MREKDAPRGREPRESHCLGAPKEFSLSSSGSSSSIFKCWLPERREATSCERVPSRAVTMSRTSKYWRIRNSNSARSDLRSSEKILLTNWRCSQRPVSFKFKIEFYEFKFIHDVMKTTQSKRALYSQFYLFLLKFSHIMLDIKSSLKFF